MRRSILFVAGEGLPFIKTGGLADVIGSLPKSLQERGHDVRVVLPLYKKIIEKHYDKLTRIGTIEVISGWIRQPATYYSCDVDGVIYYFVEHQGYFERDGLYGYGDDGERFAFFQKAVLEMIKYVNWWPNIMHENDWQTGMLPLMCHALYANDYRYQNIKHVYTIHNLAYQGKFNKFDVLDLLPLDRSKYDNTNTINYMALGIIYADVVTTVSISYAHEILSQSYGEGLQDLLNHEANKLRGILNGINEKIYDPSKDKLIYHKYTKDNYAEGKLINKKSLFKDLNFNENEADDTILIGVISRLVSQKGLDLLMAIMGELLNNKVKLVVLGTGNKNIEESFKNISLNHQDKFAALIKFDNEIAHKLYAACDLLLVPSLFEPCGLTQMIALQYGTIPLVRECGGLKDSIIPFNEYTNEGNGFSFKEYNSNDLYNTILYAINIYKQKEKWNTIINNGFACDFSWTNSALKYKELYESLK